MADQVAAYIFVQFVLGIIWALFLIFGLLSIRGLCWMFQRRSREVK